MQARSETRPSHSTPVTPLARIRRIKRLSFGGYIRMYRTSTPGSQTRRHALNRLCQVGTYDQWLVVCAQAECGSELEEVALQRITELDPERRCAA
jgi:hypothetical protein